MTRPNYNTIGDNSCGNLHGYANGAGNRNLLRKIQEVDFALYETILYLDAYPDCKEALEYYHSLLQAKQMLTDEYENKHGPLTAFSNRSQCSWDWIKSPWPWQTEC